MSKDNPLKWRGAEALIAIGLDHFKLPGKWGRSPVFHIGRGEIMPFLVFTPQMKWGGVYTSGLLGLSFAGIGDYVNSNGKVAVSAPFSIHVANFPGLTRHVTPEAAEEGAFEQWATELDRCLRAYPTSAQEMAIQLREGRLGAFGAGQQLTASPPSEALAAWLKDRNVDLPPASPLPIRSLAVPSAALQ